MLLDLKTVKNVPRTTVPPVVSQKIDGTPKKFSRKHILRFGITVVC